VFAGAEIFFRRVQGTSAFLYRVREDGTGLRKAMDVGLNGVTGVSADRRSLFLAVSQPHGWVILGIDSGAPLLISGPPAFLEWSADGKYLFVEGRIQAIGQTLVVPLSPGHLLPESFFKGFPSHAEIARMPGARVIPSGDVAAGPTGDVYAFTRETVQRNLYRIPVP
jgi:hypothetical protein